VLALASSVRSRPARAALAGAVIVMLAAALDTLSRGGLLAMVAVLVVLAILPAGALLGTPRRKATVLLGVLAAAAVVFTLPGLGSRVVSRAQTIFTTTDTSSASAGSGRSEIWLAARHAVGDHPLLGTGFGAFPGVSAQYLLTTPGVDTQIFSPRPIEVHSAFLGTAAEVGLIGLVLFAGMLVSTALALRRTAVQAFRSGAPFVGRVANACLLALLAWGISSLFLETETARAVWILIGLSLALPQLIPAATRPRWPRASASPPSRG
jgi:O-antigen ligase